MPSLHPLVPVAEIQVAPLSSLEQVTLYRILQLRSRVFVLEQECVFLDLDDLDLRADTLHLWIEEEGEVVACARLLRRDGGDELGRIAVAREARGQGMGAALVERARELGTPPLYVKAQARLRAWYEALGFEAAGASFIEDGVPHLPMRAA